MTIFLSNANRLRLLFPFFVFSFINLSVIQAQTQQYSLLWKISGKDLTKPSYLFGSMHVKNKKAFNFSDSVMRSIEKTSAFVLELHPDSILQNLLEETKANKFKVDLSIDQKEILSQKYTEKYGTAPDENSLNNPLLISDLMKPDINETDDMPTFLDAYLYGIAKTHRKKIFGLEKTVEQLEGFINNPEKIDELFDADQDELKTEFGTLLDIYINGNLKEVYDYVSLNNIENLEKRNKVMLRGILDLLKTETLFICVGVAHLPGNDGLIEMLKKEGYKVSLENVSFTGVSQNYKINPKKINWHNYKSATYKVNFPSIPVLTKKTIESWLVQYPDLMSGLSFNVVSAYNPQLTGKGQLDSIVKMIMKNGNLKLINEKKIDKYGTKVLELEAEKDGKLSTFRVFFLDNYFYTLSVENLKKDTDPSYVKLFFDSFAPLKNTAQNKSQWMTQTYKDAAFSIKTPVTAQDQTQSVEDPSVKKVVKINMFVAPDMNRHINYLYRFNDFPEGYYLADKNKVFDTMISQLSAKGQVVVPTTTIYKNGCEGRALDVVVANTYMQIKIYARGNRQYLLLKQNLAGSEKAEDDEFFDSFQFLPYENDTSTNFSIKNITANWPAKPTAAKKEDEDKASSFINADLTYQHTNKNSGGLYSLEYSDISKYYRIKSADSLYRLFIGQLSKGLDSVTQKPIEIGPLTGIEFSGIDTASGNIKKIRMWTQDQQFVMQQLISTKEEIESKIGISFFNDVKTTSKQFNFPLSRSKASQIMQDLKALDTNTVKYAKGALSFYNFEKDELPFVHQALQKQYADDTTRNSIRESLMSSLKTLNDKKSVPLLKNIFNDRKNADRIRAEALTSIPLIDTNSYKWYINTLKTANLRLDYHGYLLNPLSDSLSYVINNFESFLDLVKIKEYRPAALGIVSQLLWEDNIPNYKDLVLKFSKSITQYTMPDLEEDIVKLNANGYPNTLYTYLDILPKLDRKLTDQFTKKVLTIDSIKYIKTQTLGIRIREKLDVDAKIVAEQLDSLYSRYQIMHAYNDINELHKVPTKYQESSEFGKALLQHYVSDDYEIANIELVGKMEKGDNTYFIYSFLTIGEDDPSKYIAIVGSFKKGATKLDFEKTYAHTNYDELQNDWKKQAEALIAEIEEPDEDK